jgi:hypothetical protein
MQADTLIADKACPCEGGGHSTPMRAYWSRWLRSARLR